MEWLESIPDGLRGVATVAFVIGAALYAGWSFRRGAREAKPKAQEFSFAGQLADMGPVRELIEQFGLLVQQQIRTNMVLERLALALEGQIKADAEAREEREIDDKVNRRLDAQLRERRNRPRRTARKPVEG